MEEARYGAVCPGTFLPVLMFEGKSCSHFQVIYHNAHTMLFNWLWCRSQGGTFGLRFEDTDRERSKLEWEQVIISEMKWLGLDWDEGPDIGGPFAPYYQTARMNLYQEYFY